MVESQSLDTLSKLLFSNLRLVRPPHHSTYPELTAVIAGLQLHPTLEAILHLLNADLPSAHFLVRRLQAPPAVEGMLLHGILHRTEGDFNNARAWFSDVKDACEGWVPKTNGGQKLDKNTYAKLSRGQGASGSLLDHIYGSSNVMRLIDDVEAFRCKKATEVLQTEEENIKSRIRDEMEKVLDWCKDKFGEQRLEDASDVWVNNSQQISEMSNEMTSGDKGYRRF